MKLEKRDVRNLFILSAIYVLIIFILNGFGKNIYGSAMDWDSQHSVIPEYLRNRFYETGQFFPSFAFEVGGGQNIFYYAYYGLMSPFLLLSYLLPWVNMRTYVLVINIVSVFVAVWLFYIWLRAKYSSKISFFVSVLFLTASPFIYHSHRHIMFVDYLPFLMLSLIIIRRYFKNEKRLWPLAITAFCIVTTSFYFSVGSFLIMGIYSIMLYLEECEKFNIVSLVKRIMPVITICVIAILVTAAFLIPTAMCLFGGRTGTNDKVAVDIVSLIAGFNVESIFYGSYSMGLTSISMFAITAGLIGKDKAQKFLAVILTIICFVPIITYLMNGAMYVDGKVLIPFLPVALLLTAEFLKSVFLKDINIKKIILITAIAGVAFAVFGIKDPRINSMHIFVFGITTLVLVLNLKLQRGHIVCSVVALMSFFVCVGMNLSDKIIEYNYHKDVAYNKIGQLAQVAMEQEESMYRFGNGYDKWKTVNRVFTNGYLQTTIYSSSSNAYYKDFYFEKIGNEVSYRNNAGITNTGNILFNIYMGVKYYITDTSYVPEGYEKMDKNQNLYLYKNEDAYPVGYVTGNVISKEQFEKLSFPYTSEALMRYCVVNKEDCQITVREDVHSAVEKYDIAYDIETEFKIGEDNSIVKTEDGYKIDSKETITMYLNLQEPVDDKIIFLKFDANNEKSGKSEDIYVTINGAVNKLTAKDWKYHNNNYTFEYVISSYEEVENLEIKFSKGTYEISDIEMYCMEYSEITDIRAGMDELIIDKELTKGDKIVGTIDVKEDGWLHLSIPYDEGFTVTVDGEECPYYESDTCFIGFNISKGKHVVEIEYRAKGLDLGMKVSVIGCALFIISVIFEEVVRKKK